MKLLKENIHFVVGMSRAGTTWMTKCLNTHSECASFGETLFWGRLFLAPDKKGTYTKAECLGLIQEIQSTRFGPSDNDYGSLKPETVVDWQTKLAYELKDKNLNTPEAIFYAFCAFIAEREQKSVVVEKTPHHINWVGRIKCYYPHSKFVVMIREPYGFMLSYKYQGLQRSSQIRAIHEKQYHPLQAALVWRGYSRSVMNIQTDYNGDVLIVRNEDLHERSGEILTEVAMFLGLPKDQLFGVNLPARANSSVMRDRELVLDDDDYFWLHLVARKEIIRMGYSLRPVNVSNVYLILLSIMKLPIWTYRTIVLLRGNSKANLFQYLFRWIR